MLMIHKAQVEDKVNNLFSNLSENHCILKIQQDVINCLVSKIVPSQRDFIFCKKRKMVLKPYSISNKKSKPINYKTIKCLI